MKHLILLVTLISGSAFANGHQDHLLTPDLWEVYQPYDLREYIICRTQLGAHEKCKGPNVQGYWNLYYAELGGNYDKQRFTDIYRGHEKWTPELKAKHQADMEVQFEQLQKSGVLEIN